jgi:hypothetical protein
MSKELYNDSMDLVEKILNHEQYKDLIALLEKEFIKNHITISEIDVEKETLLGYQYEKILITPIKNNQNILEVIYKENKIDSNVYNFLINKTLSIYMVKKVKKDEFIIVDLFNRKKIILQLTDVWKGISKGELIQGFLYNSINPYLSRYSIIHPKETENFIQKEVKFILKNKKHDYINSFISKLFRKFVNSMRYSKKNPLEIYSLDL